MKCLFVSDLHGFPDRYEKMFRRVSEGDIDVVLMGGDLLPALGDPKEKMDEMLFDPIGELRKRGSFSRFLLIMGNDDPRSFEHLFRIAESGGLCDLIHDRAVLVGDRFFAGYPYVPPTPFRLKDWERYDVSRHVDPGCISPEEGFRSFPVERNLIRYGTIKEDLDELAKMSDPENTIYLFHSPPYGTKLDRAGVDGIMFDHVPLDIHVGSIAIRRFITERGPPLTLHGHIHESASLTGSWRDRIGHTEMFSAAHDGPELAAVVFDTDDIAGAERHLL